MRGLGSAGSAKPAYQEGGRGGVSTARRRVEWGWVRVGWLGCCLLILWQQRLQVVRCNVEVVPYFIE